MDSNFDFDFASYPDQPGFRRTDTSRAAAAGIAPAAKTIRAQVLAAISRAGWSGLTSDELAAELNADYSTIQPRTSELRALGSIVDSGRRRLNSKSKRVIVWTVAS